MTWPELASLLGLGVLSNTVFPMPFEPLLVAFSSGRTNGELALLCLIGSACAGAGALVDAGCFGLVRRRLQRRANPPGERRAGVRFYLFTAAAGLLPIPFTLVRAGLMHSRPRPLLFAGIVAVSRYPKYLVIVFTWGALTLPEWAGWVVAGVSLLAALEWRHAARRRRAAPASAIDGEPEVGNHPAIDATGGPMTVEQRPVVAAAP
jgi:membrane protein YqaA with SNARE-associated domain